MSEAFLWRRVERSGMRQCRCLHALRGFMRHEFYPNPSKHLEPTGLLRSRLGAALKGPQLDPGRTCQHSTSPARCQGPGNAPGHCVWVVALWVSFICFLSFVCVCVS